MVSRRSAQSVEKANPAWIPRPNSPLKNTPHKAGNGDLSITCRNRHCPKCQSLARAEWLAATAAYRRARRLRCVPAQDRRGRR
jgi:hypothetical protein